MVRRLTASLDIHASAEAAFDLICAVEKWPVWLAFLHRAERVEPHAPLLPGVEVRVHAGMPGEPEQLFEVEEVIGNHRLSLVGLYSCRRRIEFRVERKTTRSKLHVRIDYPAYGGKLGWLYDGLKSSRKLAASLHDSLLHFKALVEFQRPKDALLADF